VSEQPQKDPAAIDLYLSIGGLDRKEAMALFMAVPAGRSVSFEVTQPITGGPRYKADLLDLSTVQARDLLAHVVEHAEARWNEDPKAAELRGEATA
jgi:hypothetical protein